MSTIDYGTTDCRSCNRDVSPGATECKHCGEPHPGSNTQLVMDFVTWVLVGLGAFAFLIAIIIHTAGQL